MKPEYRAPLGAFYISKALPDDYFELVKVSDNIIHPEIIEGKFLSRDPYSSA